MKVIVITGASSGIGEACAFEFARQGHKLVLGSRRIEKLVQITRSCKEAGASDVIALHLDVCDSDSIEKFVQSTLSKNNRIDVLINNAGLALGTEHLRDANEDDWERMLNTNVLGLARITKRFLPSMIERDHGHIVNIGSIAGFATYAGGSVYAATKHAVRAISGALRLELCGTKIRISEIDPGMVETEFSLVRYKNNSEAADAVYQGMQPLTAIDIAELVYFVTSRPPHVNIDNLIVTPTDQASVYKVHRRE